MTRIIFAFLCIINMASAFITPQAASFGVTNTALEASRRPIFAAAAGMVPAIISSSAALATDGTNEWFGVDDIRLLVVLFLGHFAILSLYLAQYGDAEEDDDFFGEIDYGAVDRGDQKPLF
mmetsp:Transcript_5648/g.5373  ORF Transcript_5648/g.5373 Transcript_5648/m.5373 type:complete len:121 (+) Transcript_5648:50-412(+)